MTDLITVSRVTVIAESTLESRLLKEFWRLGIKGYSRMTCEGQGEHEVIEEMVTGLSRVRIEMIVQPQVAKAILDHVHQPEFDNYALTACIESVQVSADDHF